MSALKVEAVFNSHQSANVKVYVKVLRSTDMISVHSNESVSHRNAMYIAFATLHYTLPRV